MLERQKLLDTIEELKCTIKIKIGEIYMLKDRVIEYLERHDISKTDIKLADALLTFSDLDKTDYIESLPLYGSIPLTELMEKINYEISCEEILNHIKRMS